MIIRDGTDSERIVDNKRLSIKTADLRYLGQNYELSVPLPVGPIDDQTFDALRQGFETIHKRRFGFIAPNEKIQLVTLRLEAIGLVTKVQFQPAAIEELDAETAQIGARDVWLPETGDFTPFPIYAREKLCAGTVINGPAIVEQMDTTTVILPDMKAYADAYLNLIMEIRR